MNFYGREEEQKRIDYLLSKADFASGIVYGRHRLGKTELLRHCFYKSKKTFIIYQCNQENERSNIDDLVKIIKDTLGIKNLYFEFLIFVLIRRISTIKCEYIFFRNSPVRWDYD